MSEMSEMFRKMGLFGIGVISLTQEKVEEFSQEMIKKGELDRKKEKNSFMRCFPQEKNNSRNLKTRSMKE